MQKILETDRLFLREITSEDFPALYLILTNSDGMRQDPEPSAASRIRGWIEQNGNRCREDGFGQWAVCRRESGEMIGVCGLTLQRSSGERRPEIGYHIRRDCRRRGYAKEAARAVRNWVFRNTAYPVLCSCCSHANAPSIRTAESIGMHFDCEYSDEANGLTRMSVISKEDWLNELAENMIRWAENKLGSAEYAGWCLSFIEDALEISNGIEIFGGDSAKASCELYRDALRDGAPESAAFVFYDCLCPGEDGPVNWGHCGISLGDGKLIHAWDKVRIDGYRQIENLTALTGDHPRYIGWVTIARVLAQTP